MFFNKKYGTQPGVGGFLVYDGFDTPVENATACMRLCERHVVPAFNETCRHWSWGQRQGSSFYQKCFLSSQKASLVSNRRFISGGCKGGAARSDDALQEERKLCKRIMYSADRLDSLLSPRCCIVALR